MANTITINNITFSDESIKSIKMTLAASLLNDALSADEIAFIVISNVDLSSFTFGAPITYSKDGTLYGKFYVKEITKENENTYKIACLSAIGFLLNQKHYGGVYSGATAGSIISSIFSGTGFDYSVDSAVSNTAVSGYLPIGTKRDALKQVLFATGASLLKSANGAIEIKYNRPATATAIPASRTYLLNSASYATKVSYASVIKLTEHNYYYDTGAASETIAEYSGGTASHLIIEFDKPIVTSTITYDSTITLHNSGVNYVEISGSGKLYGVPYKHATIVQSWTDSNSSGEEKTMTVSDATLVSALNSANVLKRLIRYCSQAKVHKCEFVVNGEHPGDFVSFTDQFGSSQSGFIKDMDVIASGKNKGSASIITGWYPYDTGNNFSAYQIVQNTGTFTVPTSARGKAGRVVLFGGFRGGQGGMNGEDGGSNRDNVVDYQALDGCEGGHGGSCGAGGSGVMLKTIDIASMPNSFSITAIGAGGAGGACVAYGETQNNGSLGGETKVTISGTSYSSSSGTESGTSINIITGDLYGRSGNTDGANGSDGGAGFNADGEASEPVNGGSFTSGSVFHSGGIAPNGTLGSGGGGGASYAADGEDGSETTTTQSPVRYRPGGGGYGASASTAPAQASFACCGHGGHGGGGGGGAAGWYAADDTTEYAPRSWSRDCLGGEGGAGSNGGQGANGFVLVYLGA